ncbi:Fc.00g081430.m01.CDS01 [Cosmosporella sp. VM-42]
MAAKIFIQYPVGYDFDLEYYMKIHMPLVQKTWEPLGLRNWEIFKFAPGSQYQIGAVLTWDTVSAFNEAAAGSTGQIVFGDLKNFTAGEPTVLGGDPVPRG